MECHQPVTPCLSMRSCQGRTRQDNSQANVSILSMGASGMLSRLFACYGSSSMSSLVMLISSALSSRVAHLQVGGAAGPADAQAAARAGGVERVRCHPPVRRPLAACGRRQALSQTLI